MKKRPSQMTMGALIAPPEGNEPGVSGHVGVPVGPHVEEFCVKPVFDEDGVQVSAGITRDGREITDPVPMSPPAGYVPPSDLMWMIKTMIERGREVLDAHEIDTEEEANDFDIEDDPLDPLTPYEKVFEPAAQSSSAGAPVPSPNVVAAQPGAAPGGSSPPGAAFLPASKDLTAAAAGALASSSSPPPAGSS